MSKIDRSVAFEIAQRLPGLPQATLRALRIIDDPMCRISDLARVIGLDQTLTARVLRWANSPFYGLRSRVSTLEQAIMVLGTATVRDLLLAASATDMFDRKMPAYGLERGELWRHSVAVAAGSRWLAFAQDYANPDKMFVAGLLHDIGKLVFDELLRQGTKWQAEWSHRKDEGLSFMDLERWLIGIDHAHLGGWMAEQWNMPAVLQEIITYHHEPRLARIAAIEPQAVYCVHLADGAAHTLGTGEGPESRSPGILEETFDVLGFPSSDFDALVQAEAAAVKEAESILRPSTDP